MELDEDDKESIDEVVEHLIDAVVKFKGAEVSPEDFLSLIAVLDYGKYVISGVCYKYDLPFLTEDEDDGEDLV